MLCYNFSLGVTIVFMNFCTPVTSFVYPAVTRIQFSVGHSLNGCSCSENMLFILLLQLNWEQ